MIWNPDGVFRADDLMVKLLIIATVIGHEKDKRVFELIGLLELVENLADVLVENVHLCGVHGHAFGLPVLKAGALPRRYPRVTRRHLPFGSEESRLDLPRVALFAHLIPADEIAFPVLLYRCVRRMKWPVRSIERAVKK